MVQRLGYRCGGLPYVLPEDVVSDVALNLFIPLLLQSLFQFMQEVELICSGAALKICQQMLLRLHRHVLGQIVETLAELDICVRGGSARVWNGEKMTYNSTIMDTRQR